MASQGNLVAVLGPHVPELRALELLALVSATGSLSAAATELGITQQAASSRLRTMESLVGAPLVDRSRRGSVLTPTGELLVQWSSAVLAAAAEMDAGIAALRADRRGHLSIASSLTIAEHLLPGWLVAFRSRQTQLGQTPTEVTMTATNSERVAVMVAAVADWRMATAAGNKIKKKPGEAPPPLQLAENPDILKTVGHHAKRPKLVIGFAAETENVADNGRAKLERKGADFILANDVSPATGIMGGDRNKVKLISAAGNDDWPEMDKDAVAEKLELLGLTAGV